MTRHLPPHYVNVPVELLYGVELPPSVRLTAIRIHGLAWRHGYERTDPVSLEDLMQVCGLSRSTLYGHLATLSAKRVLRYTTVSVGSSKTFVFELLIRPRAVQPATGPSPPASPGFWTESTVVAAAVPSSHSERLTTPVNKQQQRSHAVGGECERGARTSRRLDAGSGEPDAGPTRLDNDQPEAPARSRILDALGITEPTRSELLHLDHVTEIYLQGWQTWYRSQDKLGPGWVITQLRRGAAPPPSRREREAATRREYLTWALRG